MQFEEEYNRMDISFERILGGALKKVTKKDIRTRQDLRQAWNSYQSDLILLANSDKSLIEYGADKLSLDRVKELRNLMMTTFNEFLDNGAMRLFDKKYAA